MQSQTFNSIQNWSKNLSRVRVFLTILHSSDWNLSHSHVLDDSQNAWECFAPPQLLKRFVWDKNSIHLINWPIFRIRAEKIISSRRSLIQAESWRVSIVWINRTSHRSAFVFLCTYLFMFKDLSWLFFIAQHRPKCHFWPPWPKNARWCFAPLCLYTTAQRRQTWRLQPDNQIQTACRAPTAWPGPTRLASYRKRWAIISSHFLVAVKTKAWKLAAHADEAWLSESSVDQCRSEADVQRQAIAKCRLYFSTKCVKMRICNKFDVSFHHFNEFRLQSWSFLYSEFIQDTQRTHSICRIHLFEQFTNLHIWIENLILFHRSVIWAENCHKWITTSNIWFHFSVFSAFRTFSFSADHFRHENY